MIPETLGLPGQGWILLGFWTGFILYAVLRSALRVMALSVFGMFIGSNLQIFTYGVVAHWGHIVGSFSVGLFLASVVLILITLMFYVFTEEELQLFKHDW